MDVKSKPKQSSKLYCPLLVLIAVINIAINPPIKWIKCARVITYKNDPDTLLPGPVRNTPWFVRNCQPLNWQ